MPLAAIRLLLLAILIGCQASGGGGPAGGGIVTVNPNFVTTISGTSNHVADNSAASVITITVTENSSPVVGVVPTFAVSGSNNFLSTCSATDAAGSSTCSLRSTKAEVKTLQVLTPNLSATSSVTFIAGPVSTASTIVSTGPVTANGSSAMTISTNLKDAFGNPVAGITPLFDATPGTSNVYGACSPSTASGLSTCSMTSTVAGTKTLRLTSPVNVTGGPAFFFAGPAVVASSAIAGTTPHSADGVDASQVLIQLRDANNNPVMGSIPTFSASGSGNTLSACSQSNTSGTSTCTLRSTVGGTKNLALVSPVAKPGNVVTFNAVAGGAVAANSTIVGTSTVVADGVATSTITITLRDAGNLGVPGVTPTFGATDTGTTNSYGACSVTNSSGVSTCTLSSTVAETKTLVIATPVVKSGGTVDFVPGPPSAATTTITGVSPTVADGVATSTVTVTVRDAFGNSISGQTPTFLATDTGGTNVYGGCSSGNSSGVSTCTLSSTVAETKTLSLLTPVSLTGGTVNFVAGPAVAANSSITGTGPKIADGVDASVITVTLRDLNLNPVAGVIPLFAATDTGGTNGYGGCSVTNAMGVSTCLLTSSHAETKTLSLTSPVIKSDGTVTFNPAGASALNSSIAGTGPVVADGVATSTVTITLRDSNNNPVPGQTPTFGATDTGSTNTYGACSSSDASGISTCNFSSTKAEVKTLSILTPVVKAGSNVTFVSGVVSATTSTIVGSGPVVADGAQASTITVTLQDAFGNPVAGIGPTFDATDTSATNAYGACSLTDSSGISTCSLTSTVAEVKSLSLLSPVSKTGGNVTFIAGPPVAANSSITGTGPVSANGSSTSDITISLKDAFLNPVQGITPTFTATDTNTTNVYGACSVTDGTGISSCTLASLKAETKTLAIATPVVKSDGTVNFIPGGASAPKSSISGTGPVVADGVATSTVTIILLDNQNNPIAGVVPTFVATDTGSTNSYGACSATDASGISTCTLTSTFAETKTLAIDTPVSKSDGTVTFIAGSPDAGASSILASSPTTADGMATSTVTVTILDAFNNPIAGLTPTFSATDTGTTNSYGACSVSDSSGASLCSLASTVAETKTLSITSPVTKAGGTAVFVAGAAVASNSTISGSGPVTANGSATSSITITLRDNFNNPVSGQTPTFSATDTGTTNSYGACSVSNASGISACTLSSLMAETKTLSISSPVVKADGTVIFTAGAAVALNSSITGSGPIVANGVATSTITITLRDGSNNPVSGQTPTFNATDNGGTNAYGACSVTDASGISTCTLSSLRAETKTLSLNSPVAKSDGTVLFTAGAPFAGNSTITGTGPVVANGSSTSAITVTLLDANNNPVPGQTPTFTATDSGATNSYGACSVTNASGVSTCTLSSLRAESKLLSIATPVVKSDGSVNFTAGAPVAANSNISGTGPVVANGSATSTISITLRDLNNNPVPGQTPTFTATDTGTNNAYGVCSASDASGLSNCTLSSFTAETKTLSIATPVSKADGTVIFTAGAAVAANSTITGTGPVVANGSATSTVTITLRDISNNPVSGIVPTFSATDTGAGNTYQACSATNASGVSTCTMRSTKSETKTLSIVTPVSKADGTVVFTAGPAVAANSGITGTGPVVADGSAISTITVNLRDTNNNPVSGQTPTFTATNTGSTNVYGACTSSDSSGNSTCTLKSTRAQTKTLSIATPVSKSGGTVQFVAGAASAATSQITGTTPVSADGVSTSFISITILDAFSNPISGVVPLFNATNTDNGNAYGACNASDATGLSLCTLSSTRAEAKTLQLTSPVAVTGSVVTFSSTLPTSGNSNITGSSPVLADGMADSTVTISLRDANNNPVAGITPNFDATGTGNTYDSCSISDAGGISICTMQSTTAEIKNLRITSPVTKTGGSVTFTAGAPVVATSTITGTGPVVADGVATSTVTITLRDAFSNPVSGQTPTFTATNTGMTNSYGSCPATSAAGVSTCTLRSTKAESKTLSIASPVNKVGGSVSFIAGPAAVATSTITGTGPTNPDGVSESTITITILDAFSNPISGVIPTFNATGSNNSYGTCTSTTSAGISTCTMTSTTAEVKTLSILTPVSKAGGNVTFATGSPTVANSSITANGPVLANGSALSTVTITLRDSTNAAVIGVTPTITATGSSNTYNACTASDGTGVSTCSFSSTVAEVKTVSIATPIMKAGNSVTFQPGPPSSATSTIECDRTSYLANGLDTCNITVRILDAFNNPLAGITPGISVSGTMNSVSACSATDAIGESSCTLTSTKAEGKFLTLNSPVSVSNPNEFEFNPNGIALQVPIEMVDRGLASTTSALTFNRTRTSIDPSEYEAAANDYFFEISASNANTTTAYPVQLVNGAGSVIADSTITVPANATATIRYKVQFTPSGFADTYRVRVAATATASQLKVHSARIIIQQTNAVKTKIWIPLIGGDFNQESNSDTGGTVATTTSTAYNVSSATFYYWFSRNDAAYDAIPQVNSWTLDVVMRSNNASGIAYAALYNRTTNAMVTEVTQTGTTLTQRTSVINSNATNFVTGNDYELRIRSGNTAHTAQVMKAGLWVRLKYLKRADVWWRLVNRRSTTTTAALPDGRMHYESARWSNPTANFVTFGSTNTTAIQLHHTNTSDSAATGTLVLSHTQPATQNKMTSAVSLVDNNRYIINHQRTSGTANMAGAFLQINVQE